ncbi:hypothetical protein [Streptomyces lutosisoli]|uniref:Uncharacterized protein n=1 Tax=Streptomyces lutosisoli TaxID=2665721 RepID=A0ABW2VYS3_9ACTN
MRFTPCARTAWHRHTVGQTLHVAEGVGLVATRDGAVVVKRPGEQTTTGTTVDPVTTDRW